MIIYIHVIKYLENPSFIKEKKDQCGEKIVRKDIETMILQLWKTLFPKKNVEVPSAADQNIPNDITDNFDNLADEFENGPILIHSFFIKSLFCFEFTLL